MNEDQKSHLPELWYLKHIGMVTDSLYPKTADEIFKINDLIDLRLINNKTYIFINDDPFIQCLNLLYSMEDDKFKSSETVTNMDKASEILSSSYNSWFMKLSPQETFMAHCSNIQAFFENELNTDLLHSHIAFPLLKKLVDLAYKPAKEIFTKEIIKRYNEGTRASRLFLYIEGYLNYLSEVEKSILEEVRTSEPFIYTPKTEPSILNNEISRTKQRQEELLDSFNIQLIDKAIAKIESIMRAESVYEIIIHQRYLPEVFDPDLLEISNYDRFPIFQPGVLECFELKGIFTQLYGNQLKFFKVSEF